MILCCLKNRGGEVEDNKIESENSEREFKITNIFKFIFIFLLKLIVLLLSFILSIFKGNKTTEDKQNNIDGLEVKNFKYVNLNPETNNYKKSNGFKKPLQYIGLGFLFSTLFFGFINNAFNKTTDEPSIVEAGHNIEVSNLNHKQEEPKKEVKKVAKTQEEIEKQKELLAQYQILNFQKEDSKVQYELKKQEEERLRKEEEEKRILEEQIKQEEERRKQEEEQIRKEEERRKQEEKLRRQEEEKSRKEEQKRQAQEELNRKKQECKEQWGRWVNNACTWEPEEPKQNVQQSSGGGDGVYYKNCTAARNAGAAPLYQGQPGYRPALDRDKDGVACE